MYTSCFLYGYLFGRIFLLTFMLTWCVSDVSYSLFHCGISEKHGKNIQRSSSGFLPEAEIETNYSTVSNNNSCSNISLLNGLGGTCILLTEHKFWFQHHKRRLYTWISPDGQYWNQIDYILQPKMGKLYTVNKNKTRSWLWLRSWTLYCHQTWPRGGFHIP